MRPLRLAFSLALPGCYQQAHGLATNAFPAAFSGGSGADGVRIRAVSWNVAAVNNNPFEYWITHPSTEYRDLMESVEKFIVDPGEEDVPLHAVFTESMFQTLLAKMRAAGVEQVDAVEKLWPSYRSRRIVSEFLKDATIGKKRLASMPDRVTNTIELVSGDRAYRPTVINCFPDELGSTQVWFSKWIDFFFHTDVNVDGKGPKKVHSLLQKIRKAKYPAISEEEEAASVPLQLILQGAFDAILIRLMQQKGGSNWEVLRREICTSLNSKKSSLIKGILTGTYKDADVIFLQEAGSELLSLLRREYAASHHIIVPRSFSNERAQNSIMLLRQSMFASPEEVEVSPEGWEPGDLLLVRAKVKGWRDWAGIRYQYSLEAYVWPHVRLVDQDLRSVPVEHLQIMQKFLVGFSGICNFNYKLRPDGSMCIFEVNPRVGGDLSFDIPKKRARALLEKMDAMFS